MTDETMAPDTGETSDANERTINHAQFMYYVEQKVTNPLTGEEGTRLSRRIAHRGETVTIPRAEDIERGEEAGAFEVPEEEEADEEGASAEGVPDLNFDSHDDLVEWIRDDKPTVDEVVSAADSDPDKADALMNAEQEASGGQPRKGVMDRLGAIAGGD
jgi:hypothetical protein